MNCLPLAMSSSRVGKETIRRCANFFFVVESPSDDEFKDCSDINRSENNNNSILPNTRKERKREREDCSHRQSIVSKREKKVISSFIVGGLILEITKANKGECRSLSVTHTFHVRSRMKKRTRMRRETMPTTMYDQPRNGFFPPIHDVVLIRNCFLPEKLVTG